MLVPKLRFKREDGTEYSEWEKRTLSDVCDIVGGGTPSTEHTEYWNGDIQWFTPSEIGKSKYVSDSNRTISQIGFEKSSARKLPIGTILLTSRATLGEMAIATKECTTNQGFQSLVPQKIYGEYLYYLQPIIQHYCNQKACGSTFNEISKSELGKCVIPMPCFEEQQKIADFLSNVDEVIEQSEAEVQNLEQQKKAAMQKIFSQEVRFKREDGTEYPEWEEKVLALICQKIVVGYVGTCDKYYTDDSGIIMLRTGNLKNGCLDDTEVKFVTKSFHSKNKKSQIYKGDLLIARHGSNGQAVLFDRDYEANALNIVIVRPDTQVISSNYLSYAFNSFYVNQQVIQVSAGSTQKVINTKEIEQLIIPNPCLEEQQKIADFLSVYDEAISYAKQELEHWKQLKKGLLQQMFV